MDDRFSFAAREAARALDGFTLKAEQMKVVTSVLQGRDVFAVLPTGYGKTLCYAVLPGAFDYLQSGGSSISSCRCIPSNCNNERPG